MILYVEDFRNLTLSICLDLSFVVGIDLSVPGVAIYLGPITISLLK